MPIKAEVKMKTPILFHPLTYNLKPTVHQIKQIMWGRKASSVKQDFRSHSVETTAGFMLYINFLVKRVGWGGVRDMRGRTKKFRLSK